MPRMFLSSCVDDKRPKQRPKFNYGHGLSRDLKNAGIRVKASDTRASDVNLWHAITQQKRVISMLRAVAMRGLVQNCLCKIKIHHCLLLPRMLVSYLAYSLRLLDCHLIQL